MKDHGVAIVTGGASGIGLAIAKALVGEGWKVLIADLTRPALDAAQAQIDAIRPGVTRSVVMDVADEASVIAGIRDCEAGFGPVRGLVNSAGIGRDVPFFETSVALFREILDINLVGSFAVAREAGLLMRAHGGGVKQLEVGRRIEHAGLLEVGRAGARFLVIGVARAGGGAQLVGEPVGALAEYGLAGSHRRAVREHIIRRQAERLQVAEGVGL